MCVFREEERTGYPLRIHRSDSHQQRDEHFKGKAARYLLFEAASQQPAQAARVRLSRSGHPPSYHTQQQSICR